MKTKICIKCKKIKVPDEFYWRKDLNRYENQCKQCIVKRIMKQTKKKRAREKGERQIKKKQKLLKEQNRKTKVCKICGERKTINHFEFREDSNKYRNECRECQSIQQKEWRNNNKDYVKEYEKTPERKLQYKKWEDSEKGKQKRQEWRDNNKDKIKEYDKKQYEKNKDRYDLDPKYRLDVNMRSMIRQALKGNKNGREWEGLVGYTVDDLEQHVRKFFTDGMSWDEYLKGEIHVDHRVAKSWFIYEYPEEEEFKICWGLNNLRPLWKTDTVINGIKYEGNLNKWKHIDPDILKEVVPDCIIKRHENI